MKREIWGKGPLVGSIYIPQVFYDTFVARVISASIVRSRRPVEKLVGSASNHQPSTRIREDVVDVCDFIQRHSAVV